VDNVPVYDPQIAVKIPVEGFKHHYIQNHKKKQTGKDGDPPVWRFRPEMQGSSYNDTGKQGKYQCDVESEFPGFKYLQDTKC
jgi:hypothetical protein